MAAQGVAVVVRNWNGSLDVRRSGVDGYFDATRLCAGFGSKPFYEYARLPRGKQYMEALARDLKLDSGEDVVLVRTEREEGRGGGTTWIHPRVCADLARWLSPQLAVWIDKWVMERLVPEVSASIPDSTQKPLPSRTFHRQKLILNETDLHTAVVSWVRRYYPNAILAPGLGELQDQDAKRLEAWAKGYVGGQPDLLILNAGAFHNGLALELKSPGNAEVCLPPKQQSFLERLSMENWKVLASNDYDEICTVIRAYMEAPGRRCRCCNRFFASASAIRDHESQSAQPMKRRKRCPKEQTST